MREGKYDSTYMDQAIMWSKESNCPRMQVGCVVLLRSGLTANGFNGHASGGPNEWEDTGESNPEVVHAELNALGKLLDEGVSCRDAQLFVTLSPCLECAKLIVRAGVKRVVYKQHYRCTKGIDYLERYNVVVEQYNP
ncbi:tRNA-specific adenosine deaminase [compost metagenome]